MDDEKSKLKSIVENSAFSRMGPDVEVSEKMSEETRTMMSTVFRRRFRPDSVLLVYHGGNDDGLCITKDGVYVWSEGDTVEECIEFRSIKKVDYDSEGVIVELKDQEAISESDGLLKSMLFHGVSLPQRRTTKYLRPFEGCEDISYVRRLYCLIADMVELVNNE